MVEMLRPGSSQLVAMLPDPDPLTLAETLIGFANADGGSIYVGVDESGQPTESLFPEEFYEVARQAEMYCRPPVPLEWQQMQAGSGFVFVGYVRRSPELHALSDGRILIRTGAANRPLEGDQIRQLAMTRSAGDYESEPAAGATRADLDDAVLTEFVGKWEERQRRPLPRVLDDFLVEMGWLTYSGVPTVAGLLLFGKNPQMFIPRCGLTFIRFSGTQPARGPEGEPGYGRRVEVNGPLAKVIERAWEILQEELRVGAVVRGLERQERWEYPPGAVREALVNAVAHRDYRLRGRSIEIRMYDDRIELSSPGGLPGYITLNNIVEEHFSRNPRVVSGLFQWGYIEELGLGVDLMIEEMVRAGHPTPEFRDTESSFNVVFRNVQERMPMQVVAGLTMNERQARALAYLQQHGRITNREYQQLCTDMSPETLRLDMADLVERGILLKIGDKRGTYYILK